MSLPSPYYEKDGVTIYHGNCSEFMPQINADVMLTDPPYGINYKSGWSGKLDRSIHGDKNTMLRDSILNCWDKSALVFGTWRRPRPNQTRMVLIWDTKGALGMGDLTLPWKPSHQEIYVIGSEFNGKRTSDVLTFAPVQSMAVNGRKHPHEKPVALLRELINKCNGNVIFDPFCGSGSTLVAAKLEGRRAVGIEIEEKYCEIAASRLRQSMLF